MTTRLPHPRLRRTTLWLLLFALAARPGAAASSPHPLDPLSAEEIGAAGRAIRNHKDFPEDGKLAQVSLFEPLKSDVLAWEASGKPVPRKAFVIVYSPRQDKTWEAAVDVTRPENPVSGPWKYLPDVQPVIPDDEEERLAALVRQNREWNDALRKRGIDPRDVSPNLWSFGWSESAKPRRLRAVPYLQGDSSNRFSRPIEGLEAIVSLAGGTVEVIDSWQGEPVPPESPDFHEEWIRKNHGLRDAPKPLHVVQPQGPDFAIDGHEVRWQSWRFRWQMHPRSGLTLHQVRYQDKATQQERSVLYRGSLSEMAVPYGDPSPRWDWRSAFDVGEYDIGHLAMPLTRGVEVPENARLFDAFFADNDGRPMLLRNVAAIYERDGGLLWKHGADARRGRELVLFFIATVGNYDYGISWIFRQDGSLEVEATLTGVMLAKGVKDGQHDPYSHLVAPNVAAVHHQHVLSFRMDVDVDGPVNSVYSMNSRSKDPQPPFYSTFVMEEAVFEREREACQNMDMAKARTWRIGSKKLNDLKHETGYVLVPGGNSLPLLDKKALNRERGGFMECHLWVTPYAPGELYAAGDYPNQSKGAKGLPEWTKENRKVRDTDVVLWYTLNVTHIPRPEEWPVMNVSRYGFRLVPAGFFPRNPALDVPLPK